MTQLVVDAPAVAANASGGETAARELPAEMLNVDAVAQILDCSSRHVYRLADMGRIPGPVKLGALTRWRRVAVLSWIDSGCPSCRNGGAR